MHEEDEKINSFFDGGNACKKKQAVFEKI